MADQLFKSIGVTNNMTLRGQPFLVENRINPVFVNRAEIDALRAEIDALKKQVQDLQTKPAAVPVVPPKPAAPKPAAAPVVPPKPAAPKPAAAPVVPPKPVVKPVVNSTTPVSK